MKTAEQLTADVLARRDAYLAAREKKRKAAQKYAAAGLCVCVAALAAAGLYRSGILSGDPLSPDDITEYSRSTASSGTTVSVSDPTSVPPTDGASTREPTAKAPAQNAPEPSSADSDHSERKNTTAPTEEPGTIPARQTEPTSGWPDNPVRERPRASAEQTEDPDDPAQINGNPTAAEPKTSPVEIGPSGGNHPGTTPPTTKKDDERTAEPTTEPVSDPHSTEPFLPEEDTTRNDASQKNENATYIIYDGGLYTVGDGMTVPIPEEAEVVGTRTVIVLRNDKAIPTEALILSCPSEPAQIRTAVAAGDGNEMCLMEYLGTVEELLQEDAP